jgi:predicted lysophospholipase L1 biosynthesis ABC-type transport system permease subunit
VVDHPIFLAGVIVAFVVFGAVLAYVSWIAGRRPDGHPAE